MKLIASQVELFKDLSYFDYDQNSFDLHNDFDCKKIQFENNELTLVFKKNEDNFFLFFKFQNTNLTIFNFTFNINEALTIDNLYRGKSEVDGYLKELDNNRGYFYLEFYDEQKIEFWSDLIFVETRIF
ncbi:hypothetical protein INQ45_14205 [Flavobacterium columnare]|uniref:hypothetical protein n=1 Tax=Flavobacterium columnare TaxID=996 RepID=UPI002D200E81|nr:hypothetical protein [Flavobacterium columnare]MEB3802170.1 hypothetical protein [Flavobacterium columnare]